jgi:hypothetical protein
MNRRITTAATAAMACATLLTLSACGSGEGDGSGFGFGARPTEEATNPADDGADDGPDDGANSSDDPRALHTAALDAMNAADALRYTGRVPDADGMIDMDVHTDRDGNCVGHAAIAGQGSFGLLILGDEVWIEPDQEFWMTHGDLPDENTAAALEGLHLYGTTDSPDLAEMAMVCDLEEIFGGVAIPPREVTAGADTTHEGAAARTLEVEERTGDTYTMLVAAEGEPYPLHMRGDYRGDTMTLEFSDYGVPVEVEPPAQHLVIDISDM